MSPLCGYLWVPKSCPDPHLWFSASASDVRRSKITPCHLVPIPPPPPLSGSLAAVVEMDRSRGSSSDQNSNGKRRLKGSGETAADSVAYEAGLRSKLDAEQAARERAAKELEA